MLNACPQYSTHISTTLPFLLDLLLQHLFRFVDFGGKVGAASAIGMVVQHELAMLLSEEFLGDATFTTVY